MIIIPKKKRKRQKHQEGLDFQKNWNGSKHFENHHQPVICQRHWLHTYSWKKNELEQSTITFQNLSSGYIRRLKSYRIKASRQKKKKKPPMLWTHHPSSRAPAGTQFDHGTTIRLRSQGAQPLRSAPGWRQKLAVFLTGPGICGERPLSDLFLLGPCCRLTACLSPCNKPAT